MLRNLKCDRACTVCDKAQYKEATFWDKLRLLLHLVTCKSCRRYVKNNRQLTQHLQSEIGKLNSEAKAEMQRKLDSELNKQSNK